MKTFKTFVTEDRHSGLATVASALGFTHKGDHAVSRSGHKVTVDRNGYFNLFHKDRNTGVKAAHWDGEDGFIAKAKNWLSKRKNKVT